jgi:hypothetical protein
MGEWMYSSSIPDFSTRWKWVVSFTLRPLCPGEIATSTHWIGEWGGLQSQSGHCGVEKNLTPAGNGTPVVQPQIHTNTTLVSTHDFNEIEFPWGISNHGSNSS